jgi:hypothetical protein
MNEVSMPWTKREIIDAMIAEYRPFQFEDTHTWPFFIQVSALRRLALSEKAPLGFGQGLAERLQQRGQITELEDTIVARLGRVLAALRDGRDPNVAYDTPLRGEMH